MPALSFREEPPPPDLIESVACIWFMTASPGPSGFEPILPDGRVEIVFNLGDPFFHPAVCPIRQPPRLLVGPTTRPISIRPAGAIDLVGVRLRPGAARQYLRIPLQEIRDATGTLEELGPDKFARCFSRLGEARSRRARYWIVVEALRASRLENGHDPRVLGAVSMIIASRGTVSISGVARASGTSLRTLERLFLAHAGIGPKMLARLERFHRVLRGAREGGPALMASALEAGYYDQSHLIKDFREFAGVSPGIFIDDACGELTSAFLPPPPLDVFLQSRTVHPALFSKTLSGRKTE